MEPQQQPTDPPPIRTNHFYRCMPNLYSPQVIGGYLIDFYERYVQFFSVNDFTLQKRISILQKQDQYCAQIGVISDSIIIIYGALKFYILDIKNFEILDKIKVSNYIEKCQTKNSHIIILTSEEDSDNKLMHCWKINSESGKIQEKYKATPILGFDEEECTEENIEICLIVSIDNTPRIYIYWQNTGKMIEVNPITQESQQYLRQSVKIKFVTDLSPNTYAEIVDNKINVQAKKGGKTIAQLINEGEQFIEIFSDGSDDKLFSISNLGLKRWKLESNSEPVFYNFSEKYKVQRVYFLPNQSIIGINNDSKNIVIWKTPNECEAHNFPNEIIRKLVKLNDTVGVFLLEVTSVTQEQDDEHVYKYNKLEVYDFQEDVQKAKKAIMQTKFSVDLNSLIVADDNTIRFIVNEESEPTDKKYLFKWIPFLNNKDEKDTKKKQIKDAGMFNWMRLYPFGRLIGVNRSKNQEASYSIFAKQTENKTQLVIYDFSLKKMGDYDLSGDIENIEISAKNEIYTILKDKVNIYALKMGAGEKNRLEKINQLDISVLSLKIYKNYLLVKKEDSFLLLDEEFECVMREDIDEEDKEYKIMPYSQNGFLLKTQKTLMIWDYLKEETFKLQVPEGEPNLVEYMSEKILMVDQWVQAFDVKFS